MSGRGSSASVLAAALLIGIAALFFFLRPKGPAAAGKSATKSAATPVAPPISEPRVAVTTPGAEPPSHIADDLNAPGGNIRRDLEIVNSLFVSWQTNFPREGNPVGENAEIVAALTGANRLNYAFIPSRHRAINNHGELCDRWGTPFRLHQLRGDLLEIWSAGPDRKFATPDDEFRPDRELTENFLR